MASHSIVYGLSILLITTATRDFQLHAASFYDCYSVLLKERNISHANTLCEEATAAALEGNSAGAAAKFEQALFYRPDYAQGHEMRAQACHYRTLLNVYWHAHHTQ